MAIHCTTCGERSLDLHPTLVICFDCFKAGEANKFKRSKVVDLNEYKAKQTLRSLANAYEQAFVKPFKR